MRAAGAKAFFSYARERHKIFLRRASGQPQPWTRDKILQRYRFCCVFRENDRTTWWFREHVRDSLRDEPKVMLATVVFRMLNRIDSGEAIFCQPELNGHDTPFDKFAETGDVKVLRHALIEYVGQRGPYVTGAYIISSPPGYSKLDGVLKILGDFWRSDWETVARSLAQDGGTLETTWNWLRERPYLGKFHSYEIVTDLRHTRLLESASDVDDWCNVGPGARRGINRVMGRDKSARVPLDQILAEMRELLSMSRNSEYWPESRTWPKWELREVEHTLCEFDKYERVRHGEGRPRGTFKGGPEL